MARKSGPGSRVVICCYCDARSLLPKGARGHLACHSCGAPIRVIEKLEPSHNAKKTSKRAKSQIRPAEQAPHAPGDYACRRRKKGRKRKGLLYRLSDALDDAFDLDDLFDVFD